MISRRDFLKLSGASTAAAFLATRARFMKSAFAQQGLPLPGSAIPQWVDPLPLLSLAGGPMETVVGNQALTITMSEMLANVLPTGFAPPLGWPTGGAGTYVWGYRYVSASGNVDTYIGPVIVSDRAHLPTKRPTTITWVNNLGTTDGSQVLAWKESTDQTLHWAMPDPTQPSESHYIGPVPAVVHLHGGEVPPVLDGGPDAWYLSSAYNLSDFPNYTPQGHAYWGGGAANLYEATYAYPNTQEAANIWFHDHVLGVTRLNVYAGLAGAYVLTDPQITLPTGLTAAGLGDELIVPVVIQDRKFDQNGQLFFDNVGLHPEHPFWVPEFVGDTIVVNGKTWPTFGTALAPKPSKRYRFLFLNGSNARTYELFFVDPVTKAMGPPMWVIGTDGGYLDAPQKIDPNAAKPAVTKLVLMPGERYDVIVDFNDPAWRLLNPNFSGTLILKNTGNTPYPKGAPPTGSTLGQIMKFFIGAAVTDNSYNPDTAATSYGGPLRPGGTGKFPPIVRLVNPTTGAANVTPAVTRQLTLNEVMGPFGPLEVLVNNTKWGGHSVATDVFSNGIRPDFIRDPAIPPGTPSDPMDTYYSELPVEGTTELWEIVNLTADAHPIHLHLVQFQLMNRQNFNVNKYNKAYNALFPGSAAIDPMTGLPFPPGVFIGAFGPPARYDTGMTFQPTPVKVTTFKGGNPDITPFLQGPVVPPANYEQGWKDTVVMYPAQVTRIMVRWAPTDLPANTPAANAFFPFDPNGGHGYVWHCHIIDHEDNEMMRPDSVTLNPEAPVPANRPLKKGTDY
jgi:FtsP/CotA-like multicopper oxidase with cupredoxin domain